VALGGIYLIMDKSINFNDWQNYTPITLIPVISKVFEGVVLDLCQEYLMVDDLQMGFRQKVGCADAIFAVKATINYFTERGSYVYAALLDLRKAFDNVNHFKLYTSLLNRVVPLMMFSSSCQHEY